MILTTKATVSLTHCVAAFALSVTHELMFLMFLRWTWLFKELGWFVSSHSWYRPVFASGHSWYRPVFASCHSWYRPVFACVHSWYRPVFASAHSWYRPVWIPLEFYMIPEDTIGLSFWNLGIDMKRERETWRPFLKTLLLRHDNWKLPCLCGLSQSDISRWESRRVPGSYGSSQSPSCCLTPSHPSPARPLFRPFDQCTFTSSRAAVPASRQ